MRVRITDKQLIDHNILPMKTYSKHHFAIIIALR